MCPSVGDWPVALCPPARFSVASRSWKSSAAICRAPPTVRWAPLLRGGCGPRLESSHCTLLCTGQLFGNIQIILSSKKYTQVSSGHLGSALIMALRVPMFMDLMEPPGRLPVIPDRLYSAHSLLHLTSICLDAVSTAPEERFHCLWGSPDKEA